MCKSQAIHSKICRKATVSLGNGFRSLVVSTNNEMLISLLLVHILLCNRNRKPEIGNWKLEIAKPVSLCVNHGF